LLLVVQVFVKSIVTNRTNFTVEPPTFYIPKYGSVNVNVTYLPSSVGEEEAGKVRFVSPQLGEWVFMTSGSGQKPGVHPEDIIGPRPSCLLISFPSVSRCPDVLFWLFVVAVTATAGGSTSASIPFRNPFTDTMEVFLDLNTGKYSVMPWPRCAHAILRECVCMCDHSCRCQAGFQTSLAVLVAEEIEDGAPSSSSHSNPLFLLPNRNY
jgi:hypothetical protein